MQLFSKTFYIIFLNMWKIPYFYLLQVIGKKKNNQTDAGTYCCVATVNVGASSAVLISKPAVVKIAGNYYY